MLYISNLSSNKCKYVQRVIYRDCVEKSQEKQSFTYTPPSPDKSDHLPRYLVLCFIQFNRVFIIVMESLGLN